MKTVFLSLILITAAAAQNAQSAQPAPSQPLQAGGAMQTSDVQRMQIDLNNLRSMLNAMGSEINAVRDPAVRDALRTNEQMWMFLINDLQSRINSAQERNRR